MNNPRKFVCLYQVAKDTKCGDLMAVTDSEHTYTPEQLRDGFCPICGHDTYGFMELLHPSMDAIVLGYATSYLQQIENIITSDTDIFMDGVGIYPWFTNTPSEGPNTLLEAYSLCFGNNKVVDQIPMGIESNSLLGLFEAIKQRHKDEQKKGETHQLKSEIVTKHEGAKI